MSIALKDFINVEMLQPGDRLPPERDLAVKLGVPRTALRRMLAELETEGQLIRHVGRGTFIAGHIPPAKVPRLGASREALRTYPAEVFETRLIIEPKIAALAALRATPQEVDDMGKAIQRGRKAATLAEFEHWDAVFHRLIVQSARNGLMMALYERIDALRAGKLWGRMKEQSLTPERMAHYSCSHEEILGALVDRDSTNAERLMQNHILEAKANILGD
jgi:GntR family uxuAB operon transcriptional repressor